jgi:hypothetical protein
MLKLIIRTPAVLALLATAAWSSPGNSDQINYGSCVGKTVNPSNEGVITTKEATLNAVSALLGSKRLTAGVESSKEKAKDGKEIISAPTATQWFQSPAIYMDYGFSSTRDRHQAGLDGGRHDIRIGGDFQTAEDIIVGMMFT